ncbi:MAG: methylmalonyl-CoA epimerase [Thermoplasmata archaeon]
MNVRKLEHVGIAVRSLEEASAAYEALGLDLSSVEEVPGEQVKVAIFSVGETRIELLEPTAEDSAIARFLQKRGEGIHHLAFQVDDLERTCDELEAAGVRLVYEAPRVGEGGSRVNFIHPSSARGVLIELREAP